MIRSKIALISSAILFCICMYLYFPFPNNELKDARTTFMSFPIRDQDGYIVLGIVGSVLFIIAMILLVRGLKKYHFRSVIIVAIVYGLLPQILIFAYQETFASGIYAISHDGNGNCKFDSVGEDLLNGECNVVLHNHSNKAVSFELEFVESDRWGDGERFESLMNLAGPFNITIEANRKKSIHLREIIDVSDVQNRIESGSSSNVHFKLIDGEDIRIF